MALNWIRLDSNIGSNDKILRLLSDPSPKRWQAAFSYVSALGWSGGQETDGYIAAAALPFVHGTPQTARLLVKYHLWAERVDGWEISNYADRQLLAATSAAVHEAQSLGARKGNCSRWHGAECWSDVKGRCTHDD